MADYPNKHTLQNILKHQFNHLSDACLKDILEAGKLMNVKPGETIIQQGDTTQDVFFLIFGRLGVEIQNEHGEEIAINEICQGEFFGEMSLMTGEARGATLVTTKESTLLKLSKLEFENLMDKHPSILRYLNKLLINRLQKANLSRNQTSYNNVCVLALENKPSLDEKILLLKEKLSQDAKIFLVSKESATQAGILSTQGTEKYKFSSWINDLQTQYDHLVFLCLDLDEKWYESCLLQADRILLLGTKELSNNLTSLEASLFTQKKLSAKIEKNLVIVRSEKEEISGTRSKLELRDVKNIFHLSNIKDADRIIRYIKGKSIKLVLGGGGAKGFAHIGVLKAMTELNIPIDFVGGTSIGAIMGGAIAFGWPYEQVKKSIHKTLVLKNPLNDYHLPLVSLLKGKRLDASLKDTVGAQQIEDLSIPFYAVAANFTKSKIEILDRGLLSFAIRASISLPSILPPVVKNNALLVDGGLIDNLPYDHMCSIAQGPIIGVDLSSTKERKLGYEKIPGNLSLLKQKITGNRKYKVPSLTQIVMGTMTLASEEKRRNNESKFDIYIKPDVSKFGFLKWKNFEAILQAGYDAAYPVLKEWKEKNAEQ